MINKYRVKLTASPSTLPKRLSKKKAVIRGADGRIQTETLAEYCF